MAESNYGTVYTGKQVAEQLRNSDRDYYGKLTWGSMEGDVAAQYAQQSSVLSQSYREATASAYDAYLKNQRAIQNSTLVGESKLALEQEQQSTLEQAYQSYQQSYAQGEQQLQQNYMQQINDIENALLQQGEMTAKYANYHGDYYNYLVENYGDKLSDSKLWSSRFWNEEENRLSTWNELKPQMYDEDGNLTLFGIDVLDQLENQNIGQEGMETWGEYLAQTDADVLDWAESYNPYNFTVGGSNAATFKAMTGRVSTDFEYSFLERFGGLSSERVDNLFKPFTDSIKKFESYSSDDKKNKGKDIAKDVANSFDKLSELAEGLGINKELDEAFEASGIKGGLSGMSNTLRNYISGTKDAGEMTGDWFGTFMAGLGGAGAAGGAVAASGTVGSGIAGGAALLGTATAATSAIPVVGAIVAVGAIVFSIFKASSDTDKQRELNKQLANQATAAYKAAVNNIVMYGHEQQRKAQQKFVSGII